MNLFSCCHIMAPNTRITRKWELFSGRNKFYCDGMLMSAPHTGVFYLTCFLITGTSALFFAYDCPYLATRITPFIPIIGAVLYFFTMSSLLRTTFTDPGIIPRASHDEAAYIEKQIEVPNSLNSPTYRPPPRTKEVLVKGQVVKLKYCFTCKIFRPPRASHCSLCDNCVDRFDHHCPWVGNCVGKRNYRFFYMFLVSLAFLAVFIFSCSITHLVLLMKVEKDVWEVIKKAPFSVIVTIICFFSIWSVIGLAGFHTYLTTSDQTTNEDLKGSFSSKSGSRAVNPYSRGNICMNCVHILCGPMTPSLIDRRGIVTDDFMLQMQHYSPNHPITDIPTIQTPNMIHTQQPIGGNDVLKPLPRLFDETLSASGMYRHRSYDNLQNGNSNSLATLVDNEIPLSTLENSKLSNSLPRHPTVNNSLPSNQNLYYGATSINDGVGSGGQQHLLSPVISVPTSNSSTMMLIDDDALDTSIAMLPNKNNLSGSYNNLFRDNLENSCSDSYMLENMVVSQNNNGGGVSSSTKNDDVHLQQSVTMHNLSIKNNLQSTRSQPPPPHSTTMCEINLNKLTSSSSINDILQQQQLVKENKVNPAVIDNHSNIPAAAATRRLFQLQSLEQYSENFYSNIPSTNLTTFPSNDLNKSDPNLHLYSNLIEEHQVAAEQQILKQKRHSEPSQQPQQLISKFEKNKTTTVTAKSNELKDTMISSVDNNKQTNFATKNFIKGQPTTTTKKQRKVKSNDEIEANQIAHNSSMPSTLLSDDLDLDDPVSAFVANSRKKLQSSQKNRRQKNYDSKELGENGHNSVSNLISNSDKKKNTDSHKIKHLHDTTMIDTALDLDSLDGTSIGLSKSSAIV